MLEFFHVETARYPTECQADPSYDLFLCGFMLAFHWGSKAYPIPSTTKRPGSCAQQFEVDKKVEWSVLNCDEFPREPVV